MPRSTGQSPLNGRCPECGGHSMYAGNDAEGSIYTCETPDGRCVVFDHWADDVRTYRSSHRGAYRAMHDDEE